MENPHDVVGVFVAGSLELLAEMVDECCDVSDCEYVQLPAGGFYMPSKAAPAPFGPPPDDDVEFFPTPVFLPAWSDIFFGPGESPWKALSR